MFAILLSEKMDPFYQNISSFPTVIYTFFLVLVVFYWLVAVLGLVDIEILDFDLDVEGANPDSGLSNPDVLAGLMLRFGLNGVPVTIILSFIALFGWFLCYFAVHFTFPLLPSGFLQFIVGIPVLLATFYIAVMLTALVIKPLRTFFKNTNQDTTKYTLGQVAIVRTSRVDSDFGEAVLEDGGAGLILKVRATGDETFKQGDKVVLFEYIEQNNAYRVISEQEFAGSSSS